MSEKSETSFEKSFHLLCMLWAEEANISKDENTYILTIKNIDRKILYSTSRPKVNRGFIETKKFLQAWVDNKKVFEEEVPEIAFTYNQMQADKNDITHAVPIDLTDPLEINENTCKFTLKFRDEMLTVGKYSDIVLFIDWFPTTYIPKPVKLIFHKLFD